MSIFIIAEAGVNHNGSTDLARKLIDAAVIAGADAIKFQTFKAENLVSKRAKKAQYQINASKPSESQFEMIRKLELSAHSHKELNSYAIRNGIMFLSSPFDHESIDLLKELDLSTFKIPSGEITNLPYLRYIGKLQKKIILSSGMSSLKEVGAAIEVLVENGTKKKNITVLHANSMYPTPMIDVNLKAMLTIQKEFNVAVGYSDHTLGTEIATAAAALGASVIEKHFTLDKSLDGPDHKASLNPDELKKMIGAIRNIEQALGDGVKKPTNSESPNISAVRKSIIAIKQIKKGDILNEKNIAVKRPGGGISPMEWDSIVGTISNKEYQIDDLI